jgi:hypothetical protein
MPTAIPGNGGGWVTGMIKLVLLDWPYASTILWCKARAIARFARKTRLSQRRRPENRPVIVMNQTICAFGSIFVMLHCDFALPSGPRCP